MPNVLSLFSGIGGLELGLERAGMTVVGQVEIDLFCQRVLAKHWPEVPRHDDVRTAVEWWESEPRPRVDLVCGGFPCQPVSLSGKGLAQADPRWLWPAYADVVRALRPRYVLVENVPGLLGRGLGDVLGDLAESGYDADWDCVPASAVGAPHRRDRVWIMAHTEGEPIGTGFRPNDAAILGGRRPSNGSSSDMAHAEGQRRGALGTDGAGQAGPDHIFGHAGERRRDDAWATEPDVGRVAHGVPDRVDRLRALGNAVVPQVAQHIGEQLMAHLTAEVAS